MASGLSTEDDVRQVSTLLYCLGEEADDILTSINITDDDRKKYFVMLAKFDGHFKVHKNVNLSGHGFPKTVSQFGVSLIKPHHGFLPPIYL